MKTLTFLTVFFLSMNVFADVVEEAPVPSCIESTEYITVKLTGAGFEEALVDRINYFAGLIDGTHKAGKIWASGNIAGANTQTLKSETCPASSTTCTTATILTRKVNQYRTFLTAMSGQPVNQPLLNFSYTSCQVS